MTEDEELAEKLYPEFAKKCASGYAYGPADYDPMIRHFGTVALQIDDEDCSGDTRVLYVEPDGRIGVLIFGWGSCFGCDSLQACSNMGELSEVIEDTRKEIKWFDTSGAALQWFEERDWLGQYSWHEDETKRFVEEAKAALASLTEAKAND